MVVAIDNALVDSLLLTCHHDLTVTEQHTCIVVILKQIIPFVSIA